jgi:hypothetical protein
VNAPQTDSGRRRFLTRLFQPDPLPPQTTLVALPGLRPGSRGVFWSLAGLSEDDCYVAGDDGVLFHFDGEQWQREHPGAKHNIHAICFVDGEVYTVGWLGQICARRKGQWSVEQGGGKEASRVNLPLFDIAVAGDGKPWAVGDQGRITHLVKNKWCEQDSGTKANLRCVLPLDDGRVLAGGLGGTFLEKSGDNWREVETHTGCAIVSIARQSEDSFIAVGGEYSVPDGEFLGRIFLYREGEFVQLDTGQRLPRLRRVRRAGEELLIVGDGGNAYRWTGKGVSKIPGRARYDLHDVLGLADGSALICGDCETLLQERPLEEGEEALPETHCRWETLAEGLTLRTLRSLWALDEQHIVAAGDGGEVFHLRNGAIERKQIPGKLTVHALWGTSPRNLLAACDAATVAHFDGEEWSLIHQGEQDVPLLAITGFGPHDIFAVGDAGLALRFDGLMWRQLETGSRQELYGLWGQDSQHLLAVGGGGLVLRFDGDQWKPFTAGTEQDLCAVHGSSLQKLYLAGFGGTLIRFEDNAWHREFTGVRADLNAMASTPSGDVFAVGSNGTVLCLQEGAWQPEESGVSSTLQALLSVGSDVYAAGSGGALLKRVRGANVQGNPA